jgi:hypothetical protein
MCFPRNWEFGSALSKIQNFGGGGFALPKHPPRYVIVAYILWNDYFSSVAQHTKSGLGFFFVNVSISHAIRQTTPGMSPLNEGSVHRRSHYLLTTQQTQETDTNNSAGFEPLNPSNEKATDVQFKPRGHRLRPSCLQSNKNVVSPPAPILTEWQILN